MESSGITIDPAVMGGKPCVGGTRVTVEYILELLMEGHTIDTIVAEHRALDREAVEAAIAFAREAVRRGTAPAAK